MPKNKLPNNLLLPYVGLFVATLIWGAAGPIIKYTLDYIPPITFLFLRFLIVCIIMLPYTIYEIQKVRINSKDYFNLFLFGLFSQTSLVLIFIGLKYTTALDNAIIGLLGSLLAVAAGYYFYNDKINSRIKMGIVLSSIGTVIVVLEPVLIGNHGIKILERIFGNSLILLHNLFWVIFIIWSKMSMGERSPLLKKSLSFIHLKPMSKNYPPTLITSISMFVGLLSITPVALFEILGIFGPIQYFNIMEIGTKGILGLLYMSILSSVVAYVLYQKALKYVNVTDTAFFGYLSPIFTLPVAYLLLKEIPNKFVIVGAIFIAIGVCIAERKPKDNKR